jgi:hypothetical protein
VCRSRAHGESGRIFESPAAVQAHPSRVSRSAFSKKLENFKAAIALHLAYYNFVKTHGSLRCTPAMEAGIENSAWKVSDLVNA